MKTVIDFKVKTRKLNIKTSSGESVAVILDGDFNCNLGFVAVYYKHETKALNLSTADSRWVYVTLNKNWNYLFEPLEHNYINPEFDKYA